MDTHRFAVGQTVRLLQSVLSRGKSISCEILQIMPVENASFQYRVRGEDERFDRIAQEHELADIPPLPDGTQTARPTLSRPAEKTISVAAHAMKGKE